MGIERVMSGMWEMLSESSDYYCRGSDAISAFVSEFDSVCLKNGLRLLGPDNDRSSLHSCNVNGHSQKRAVDPRIYFILCLISNLFIF